MKSLLKSGLSKLQVIWGSRCRCGGVMKEVAGWNKSKCDQCGKTVKT